MTISRQSPLSNQPNAKIQQAAALPVSFVEGLNAVVRATDADYTVNFEDDLIILASNTSTGNYTLTFPTGSDAQDFHDASRIKVVLPAALGGTDAYETAGVVGAPQTFDAAGDAAEFIYLKEEDEWHVFSNNIA